MTIGEKIHEIRIRKCITLEEFATAVGTHTETVCRWETGKTVPSLKSIRKIADAFALDVTVLTKCL